jgi:hypothetical protein
MKVYKRFLLVMSLFMALLLVQCTHQSVVTAGSKSCLYGEDNLVKLTREEVPERVENLSWSHFPEHPNIIPKARETLEPYSEEFKSEYKYIDEVYFSGGNFLVSILKDYNTIHIITKNGLETVKDLPIPYYGHYLYAKQWVVGKEEFLVIYVDLKATKNLSILFVLDRDLNLVFRDCFSRAQALAVGDLESWGAIFAIKHRPNEIKYFSLRKGD